MVLTWWTMHRSVRLLLALFVTELVLLATLLAGAGAVPDSAGGMAGAMP